MNAHKARLIPRTALSGFFDPETEPAHQPRSFENREHFVGLTTLLRSAHSQVIVTLPVICNRSPSVRQGQILRPITEPLDLRAAAFETDRIRTLR